MASARDVQVVNGAMMKCPKCGSAYVRRSRIRWWERPFLRYSPKTPHRCEECAWRGLLVHEHVKHPHMRQADLGNSNRPEIDLSSLDEERPKP